MAIHNTADNSFKLIFGDHRLFSDFLRDFIHIDVLKNVQPEDIEDISERFIPLFQGSRDLDTVKRIKLKSTPLFVICILEHQSEINFRSSFKMLQYICLVLDAVEKLNLQIPENMRKLLSDVIRIFLEKSGVNRQEAREYAGHIENPDGKENKGMFEAAIESILKRQEEVREEGREERDKEIARNALAEGYPLEAIQRITGLDMETLKSLSSG